MDELLTNILKIKDGKGITDQQFAIDLGLYKTIVSEWKNGSVKSYEKHVGRIADYLGVSVDSLRGKPVMVKESEATYSLDKELSNTDFALSGELHDLTENEKKDLIDYIRFKKSQRKQEGE